MAKQIISGIDALTKILAGVNLIANPVKATLGPAGRNCIYERIGTNLPVSTRDGVTVAEQIESDDPHENMGINLIKGIAREAVDSSGDGTTTATLIGQSVYAEGVRAITVGANPVAVKRGIQQAVTSVVQHLQEMSIPISGDMIRQVATISANNDEFLGGLIAMAMEKSGDDGVVAVEVSRSPESSLDIVDGLQFGTGFLSPYFVNDAERNECVLEDVAVFLHEKKLSQIQPMLGVIQELAKSGKSILVIAEDVTDEALAVLAVNTQRGVLKACAVKSPGGIDHLNDIASLTGAKVLTALSGTKLANVGLDYFGSAKKTVVKPTTSTIIAVTGDNVQLNKRLAELRSQIVSANEGPEKLRLQGRLARLAGGVAIIRVGGQTELEMLERKDRIEDALHATRCAMKEGVLPGGGVALLRCAYHIPKLDGDEAIGAKIINTAMSAPIRTLAENCGESPEYILREITSHSGSYGWNARTGQFGDMIEMGVLDPLRVVRVALESAASVASLMLITHTLVANGKP